MQLFNSNKYQTVTIWGLKIALACAFLSAVADRFGFWGAPGSEGVVWGNFENFTAYTKILIPWSPDSLIGGFAWIATLLELVLGILLCTNVKTKEVAFISGALLMVFGLSMLVTVGPKAVLDYSVFSGAFAGLFLASYSNQH